MPYAGQTWTDGVTPLDSVHMSALDAGVVGAVDVDNVAAAASVIVQNKLGAGDTQPAFRILGDGTHGWGAGSSTAPDTTLYRLAAGQLKTDGKLVVANDLSSLSDVIARQGSATGQVALYTAGVGFGNPIDTNLYRAGPTNLKSDGSITVRDSLIAETGRLYIGAALDTSMYRASATVLRVAGSFRADNYLDVDYGGSGAQLRFGSAVDTTLYRASAGVLKTDGKLVAGSAFYSPSQTGTYMEIGWQGTHIWWSNDTNLYRPSAALLRTDGGLRVGQNIVADGNVYVDFNNFGAKLYFGSAADTSLYRAAAGSLATNGNLTANIGLAYQAAFYNAGGNAAIGFGNPIDVSLFRAGPGVLQTDGRIYATNVIYGSLGANQVGIGAFGPASQAGIQFGPDATFYRSSAGNITTDGTLGVTGNLALGTDFYFKSLLVTFGAADSGGSGFRALVVPN